MATQTLPFPFVIRTFWNRWVTPRATDRDEAFREITIRISTAALCGLMAAALAAQVALFSASQTTIPYTILICLSLLFSVGAALTVNRHQLVAAGWLLTGNFMIIAISLAIIHGLWSITVPPFLMLTLIVATLVLPRPNLIPVTAGVVGSTLLIALLQNSATPVLGDSLTNNLSFATYMLVLIVPLSVVYLRQLRLEFDNRLAATNNSLRETQSARQEAEQANKTKSQFLANMSHELRTPLNAIIGYTEIMIGGLAGPFTAEQLKLQTNVDANAKRLLNLINDILDLSRIEAGRIEFKPMALAPQAFLTDLTGAMQSLATKKNLKLELTFGANTPNTVTSDTMKLQQIVVNLLGNALKFTKQGTVEVLTDSRTPDTWEIKVRDTGIGIPADALPKIFDVFQQVDTTDSRQYEGTGLGLAIVKNLVQHMNGTVTVQSTVGAGSTFTVTLPRTLRNT